MSERDWDRFWPQPAEPPRRTVFQYREPRRARASAAINNYLWENLMFRIGLYLIIAAVMIVIAIIKAIVP